MTMAVVDVLKGCALFKGFTDTGVQILAGIVVSREFPKGVPLFVENMMGDSLVVLAEGRVQISAKNPGGEEVTLGELGPGDFLGELTLVQQGRRMCTATAQSAVKGLEIRHADFQKLLGQKPQACMKLLMNATTQFALKVNENRETFRTLIGKGAPTPKS